MRARLVVQRPDQARQLAASLGAGLDQRLERLGREGVAAHGRHGVEFVVQQRDSVEDTLDDPQLVDLEQVHGWRAPPVAFHALARREACLLLAEAVRAVDQPFPVPTLLQGEAHCGTALGEFAAPVVLLAVPAADHAQVEATGELQVGIGAGSRRLLGARCALAPVVEQVVEQLFHVPLLAALALAAAFDEPGLVVAGIELLLAAARAGAAAHVVGSGAALEAEVALETAQHLFADLAVHVFHWAAPHTNSCISSRSALCSSQVITSVSSRALR